MVPQLKMVGKTWTRAETEKESQDSVPLKGRRTPVVRTLNKTDFS